MLSSFAPSIRLGRGLAAALIVSAAAAPALALDDDDLLSSVYTESGFEIRQDERIFTLFAVLNAAGFSRAETTRAEPFPRYLFHPIRETVRQQFAANADKLSSRIEPVHAYLDSHPFALDQYVAAVLALSDDAALKPGAGFPKQLAGLDAVLRTFAKGTGLDALGSQLSPRYRQELKRLSPIVDGPFAKLRAAYKLREDDAPLLVLVPNPLDSGAEALARRTADDMHVVVLGLSSDKGAFDPKPALRAYSALLAEEAAAEVPAATLDALTAGLRAQGALPAGTSARTLLRDGLRAAAESQILKDDAAGRACQEALLCAELAKVIAQPLDSFPAEDGSVWAQAVAKLDVKKAAEAARRR